MQAHFFDVLLTRSENSREEALSGVMWPRCIVCTTIDLEVLRQAVFAEDLSETHVESKHLLMKRFPPAPAPTVVVCWSSCDRPCRRLVIRSDALQRTSHGKMRASGRCVFKMHSVGAVNIGRLHRGIEHVTFGIQSGGSIHVSEFALVHFDPSSYPFHTTETQSPAVTIELTMSLLRLLRS